MIGPSAGTEPLLRRLETHSEISLPDRMALQALPLQAKSLPPGRCFAWDGEPSHSVTVLLSGWACTYKMLGDGSRQVLAYHLPGDLPDLHAADLGQLDGCISTLTACTFGVLPLEELRAVAAGSPGIDRLLRRELQVQASLSRAWLANVGQRPGPRRAAHFLCETYERLAALDMARDGRMRVPVSQGELADALGMTGVHVNRVIQELRGQGLVEWRRQEVVLPDRAALALLAGYDGSHLHLRTAPPPQRPLPDFDADEEKRPHLRLVAV